MPTLLLTPAAAKRLGVAPGPVECVIVNEDSEVSAREVRRRGKKIAGTVDVGPDGVLFVKPEPTKD